MRHIHADVIIAWANGAGVEVQNHAGEWHGFPEGYVPSWDTTCNYRVKPAPRIERRYHAIHIWPELPNAFYIGQGFYGACGADAESTRGDGASKQVGRLVVDINYDTLEVVSATVEKV